MPYNTIGRKRFFTTIAVLAISLINLALSGSVNVFQDFFYVADQFPFALSIITLVMYGMIFSADISGKNSFIVRAPFLIPFELLLCVFWTAGNSFSTSRWSGIPLQCNEIPTSQEEERVWCKSLQALKSFIWIEWLILVLTFVYTVIYVSRQYAEGSRGVWNSPLARTENDPARHFSEFLQYPPAGPKYATGPTPIPDEFSRGHASGGSRGQADMTAYQTDSLKRGQTQADPYARPPAVQVNTYAEQAHDLYAPQADAYQDAYGAQAGAYTYGTPEMPPQQNWAYQDEGARDSVAGGPGLAGVGVRPAPGAYGGFERM